MKNLILLFFVPTLFACTSIPRDPAQEDSALSEDYRVVTETAHFKVFQINEDLKLTTPEIISLSERLEKSYAKVADFLKRDVPQHKVSVYLEGDGLKDPLSPHYPSTEMDASIHLYRYPESFYDQGIRHELVHVFRIENIREHSRLGDLESKFGFIEEAFAEYVSISTGAAPLSLNPKKHDITLSSLFRHHDKVPEYDTNSFATRASFFKYLEETYGRDKVFELAYYDDLISESVFEKIFTRSFLNLTSAFQVWNSRTAYNK